jgi:hypothetical protein
MTHTQWPALPDPAVFHGPAGEFVVRTEPHTESDPMALLSQFLIAFGTAAGAGAHYAVEASRHHSNEFVVLASGGRARVLGPTALPRRGGCSATASATQRRMKFGHWPETARTASLAPRSPISSRATRRPGKSTGHSRLSSTPVGSNARRWRSLVPAASSQSGDWPAQHEEPPSRLERTPPCFRPPASWITVRTCGKGETARHDALLLLALCRSARQPRTGSAPSF